MIICDSCNQVFECSVNCGERITDTCECFHCYIMRQTSHEDDDIISLMTWAKRCKWKSIIDKTDIELKEIIRNLLLVGSI